MTGNGWVRRYKRLFAGTLTIQRFDAICDRADTTEAAKRLTPLFSSDSCPALSSEDATRPTGDKE